jgi:hypothetical protein
MFFFSAVRTLCKHLIDKKCALLYGGMSSDICKPKNCPIFRAIGTTIKLRIELEVKAAMYKKNSDMLKEFARETFEAGSDLDKSHRDAVKQLEEHMEEHWNEANSET